MTKEEAVEMLRKLQTDCDTEKAHMCADSVLCDLLISLGCKEVVQEYGKIKTWYA
jgi:hypothetical protein